MSGHETLYSARVAYPDYYERGRAQTASLPIYRSGVLVPPAVGDTYTLYDPTGTSLVTGTITIASDVPTFPLLAGHLPSTLAYGHGYWAIWALTLGSEPQKEYRRDVCLVKHAAVPTLTDQDLAGVYSDLSRHLASGTSTFQAYIDEAWKRILGRLESQGVFPEHLVTYWSLREVHMELALHLICLDFARASGGRWLELAPLHKKEFELAWARLRFVKGTGDGGADGDGLVPANRGVTHLNASPRASWRGFGGM